jgi:diacylglycerol kinase family enzyme
MNGRYYGGGMNVTPLQDRLNPERTVSLGMFYGKGRIKTLIVFPKIFKGEHVKHTEMFETLVGRSVTVEFDRPCALQIDGETVLDVSSYTVESAVLAKV